jgi:hypothetical protein
MHASFQQCLSSQSSAKDDETFSSSGPKPIKLSSYNTFAPKPQNWPPLFIPSSYTVEKECGPEVLSSSPPPAMQFLKTDTDETVSCKSKPVPGPLVRHPPDMSDHKILREFVDKMEEYRALCVDQVRCPPDGLSPFLSLVIVSRDRGP